MVCEAFETLNVQQVLEAAGHRRDFARATLDDARARFEAGLVSSNDVTKAQLELATAERVVAQAQGDMLASRVALSNVIEMTQNASGSDPSKFVSARPHSNARSPGNSFTNGTCVLT